MTHSFAKFCSPALIAMALAAPAFGQTTDAPANMAAIEQAWQEGDFEQVRQGLKTLAETDPTPLVHYRYGRVLIEGRGGPTDMTQGVAMLEKAVAQNHVGATTLLARVFLSIQPPARDPARAASLFANAAARGNAEAQYYLGLLYKAGLGVDADPVAAFNWFLASSEGQNPDAQLELGRAYAAGTGTAQNGEKALQWLEESASRGQSEAQLALADLFDKGTGVLQSDSNALKWYTRAAEAGNVAAQRILGTKYLQGIGDQKPDAENALLWLGAAAKAGDASAMNNLGVAYSQGTVLPKDETRAVDYFTDASDRKLARATLAWAGMVEAGRGTEPSMKEAVELYLLAADQGETAGLDRLGQLALAGRLDTLFPPHHLVEWIDPILDADDNAAALTWMQTQADAGVRDAQAALGAWSLGQEGRAEDAIALLKAAALSGHVPSQHRLGSAYSTGDGAELDYIQAYAWLNVAAASGNEPSVETRNLMTELMTPDQVAEGQALARSYFEEADSRVPQTVQTVTKAGE